MGNRYGEIVDIALPFYDATSTLTPPIHKATPFELDMQFALEEAMANPCILLMDEIDERVWGE
jgi:hypothetical protein